MPAWQRRLKAVSKKDNLTRRDFSLERIGDDTQTIYVLDPKDPVIKKLPSVTEARIRELVLEACPPWVVTTPLEEAEALNETESMIASEGEDVAPDF